MKKELQIGDRIIVVTDDFVVAEYRIISVDRDVAIASFNGFESAFPRQFTSGVRFGTRFHRGSFFLPQDPALSALLAKRSTWQKIAAIQNISPSFLMSAPSEYVGELDGLLSKVLDCLYSDRVD